MSSSIPELALIQQDFIDQMPGLFVALDQNSKFLAANKTALNWTGFKSYDAMLNTTYSDMPCKASEQHEAFIQQDKIIFDRDGYGRILGFYCYDNNDWKIIFAEKYPLIKKNKLIAIASYITDISHANIIDITKFSFIIGDGSHSGKRVRQQGGYLIENSSSSNILTPRELECLFFIMRGKTIKEIASLFAISKRTVEKHSDNIKIKFKCSTKSELINKAIEEGYMNQIPQGLLGFFKE